MPAKKPRWLSEHRSIVEHLKKGETERAVFALQAHLEAAAEHLLERMTRVED
jgi:DNA-binding GntR family transcriptional regulator